jgi:hypothetical protein
MLNFIGFFCVYWDDQVVFVFASVYVLHYIFWFANVEPPCASLRWSQLDHDEWLFCYFIFDFPLFYWGHLHQCPLRRLACRSFWSVVAFIVMKCLSLSCLTNIILKSTLPDVNIATPAYLGGPWVSSIFQPFSIRQCLFLSIRCVSYKQQIVRYFFLIQLPKWWLLKEELIPLTFSVNIDWDLVLLVI